MSIRAEMVQLLEGGNPFVGLSDELQASLNSFAGSLAFWMGNPTLGNMQSVSRTWKGSKELRSWLKQHVNLSSYTLFYGRRLEDELPVIGAPLSRRGSVLQWSTRKKIAQWFAGIGTTKPTWAAGALVQATATGSNVVVDIDRFSALAGRHHKDFAALMTRSDPVEMFSGEQYEGEVLTTSKVKGTIIEVERF